MRDRRKKLIYWSVHLILLAGGIAVSIFRILPLQNSTIFLLGSFWVWTGLSAILNVNPMYAQQYDRRHQLLQAASSVGMGIAWVVLACFPGSKQALPVLLASTPFILLDLWCLVHKKRHAGK